MGSTQRPFPTPSEMFGYRQVNRTSARQMTRQNWLKRLSDTSFRQNIKKIKKEIGNYLSTEGLVAFF